MTRLWFILASFVMAGVSAGASWQSEALRWVAVPFAIWMLAVTPALVRGFAPLLWRRN